MEGNQTGEMEWNDAVDLFSIELQNHFIERAKSNADIIHEEDEHDDVPVETCLVDDETNATKNLSHLSTNQIKFYGSLRMQIDNGAKVLVTNLLEILHDIKF